MDQYASIAGTGNSLYIDGVILRDRDNLACGVGCDARLAASNGTLEQRRYLVQNWRADVTTMLNASGEPVEWYRYTAYGQPTSHPIADMNGDGDVTSADTAAWLDLSSGGECLLDSNFGFASEAFGDWSSSLVSVPLVLLECQLEVPMGLSYCSQGWRMDDNHASKPRFSCFFG